MLSVLLLAKAIFAVDIACVGDSITYSGGDKNYVSYPTNLGINLGDSFRVFNYGKSGTTASPTRDAYVLEDTYQQALSSGAEIFVVQLGTNDAKTKWWNATLYKSSMHELLDSFADLPQSPQIVLGIPPPYVYEDDSWADPDTNAINTLLPTIVAEIAGERGVPYANHFQAFGGYENFNDAYYYLPYDGIHPNPTGYERIAWEVYQVLREEFFPDITYVPTSTPSLSPTKSPTLSLSPTYVPTKSPTHRPSPIPTYSPTYRPTFAKPTARPSTPSPSLDPTTAKPSRTPTSHSPSYIPTYRPTSARPSDLPLPRPTRAPTESPASRPTPKPVPEPSSRPSREPSPRPSTYSPSTRQPSSSPSATRPTPDASPKPTTSWPTFDPTTYSPTTSKPSRSPSSLPTSVPTTYEPSAVPTYRPSFSPTARPTGAPTPRPSPLPSPRPTYVPTSSPTFSPTATPSIVPSPMPSRFPTISFRMTVGLAGISGVATNRGGFGPEEAQVFEDSVEDVLDLGQGSSVTVVSPITSSLSPPSRRHLEETEGGETDVVFEIYAPETLEVLGYTLEAVVDSGALTEEIQTRGSDTALADAVVDDVSVGYSHAPTISSTEKDSKKKKSSSKATSALLWVALAVGILILLCFGTSAFCWRRRRRRDDEIVPKQCIMSPSSIESDYKDDQEDDEIDLDNIELEDVSSPACKTRRSLDESFLKSPAVVYHSSDDEKVASAPKIVLLRSTSSASPDDNLENRDDLHASSAEQLPVVTLDVVDDDATSPDLETKAIPTDTALSLLPEDEYQSAPANLSLVVEDQREAVLDVNYGPTSQEIDPVPNSQTQASPHATQNFERPPSPRCLKLNIGDDMKTTEDEIQSGASAEGTKKHREVAF